MVRELTRCERDEQDDLNESSISRDVIAMRIVVGPASPSCCQTPVELNMLNTSVNVDTAVRLFFTPGNYFHAPIIFRVVAPKDSRLNTAPMVQEGRTLCVSMPEMEVL